MDARDERRVVVEGSGIRDIRAAADDMNYSMQNAQTVTFSNARGT